MKIENDNTHVVFMRSNDYNGRSDITLEGNPVLNQYHNDELSVNKIIVYHMIGMCWVGIAIMVFAVIFLCAKGFSEGFSGSVLMVISGGVVDVVSGVILVISKRAMDSKDKYFESLSRAEEIKCIMDFINKIDNPDTRSKCQQEYVDRLTIRGE